MPRPQFTVRALLVAMLVVGAFLGGAAWQRSMCEIYEWDVEEMRADIAAQREEEIRLLEKIKWMRRCLAIRDPAFDVPDADADRAPSGMGVMGRP